MSRESLRLLEQLRYAIHKSLGSVDIVDALSALEGSGHQVSVSVDATIDEADTLLNLESAECFASDPLLLTQSDELFLQAMHISAGSE